MQASDWSSAKKIEKCIKEKVAYTQPSWHRNSIALNESIA
jgi:hypothetical protein